MKEYFIVFHNNEVRILRFRLSVSRHFLMKSAGLFSYPNNVRFDRKRENTLIPGGVTATS